MNSVMAGKGRRILAALVLMCLLGTALGGFSAAAKEIQQVKTIQWKAKTTKSLRARSTTGEMVTIRKGANVVVTDRGYRSGERHVIRYKGKLFKVPHGSVSILSDLCSVKKEKDYNRTTKEWFVNQKHRISSRTNYLIWTSLDKQRTNVYHREDGRWVLIKTFKCSTGKAEKPTKPSFGYEVSFKRRYFTYDCGEGLHTYSYYVEYAGSGFHVWPGGRRRGIFGEHTVSSGCIRLGAGPAKWLFDTIPVHTKVIVW